MARGINDSDVVVFSLELPQSDIDGDTTFALRLQLVQHPSVLEGTFAHLSVRKGYRKSPKKLDKVVSIYMYES